MQINLKLDCTLYSGLGVHFHRNTQLVSCHLSIIFHEGDLLLLEKIF